MNNGNGANGNEEGAFGELGPLATTHVCADMCAGFQYFALQYASQCFCGNSCETRPYVRCLCADHRAEALPHLS